MSNRRQTARARLEELAEQAMLERNFETRLSAAAEKQLESIDGPAGDSAAVDLTGRFWISIDNQESLDLDQLSIATAEEAGTRLLVAIADVDALVAKDSPIDLHAATNTTSVYTPPRIFSMLPEKLSHGFTSLLPDGDRLALVVEMLVANDGSLQSTEIYRALVRNHAKLVYEDVAKRLDEQIGFDSSEIDEQVRLHIAVSGQLQSLRREHGALDFETIEPKVVFPDEEQAAILEQKHNRARQIIEDLMIAANGVTARFLENHGFSSIRRVVRSPQRWDRITAIAVENGASLPDTPDPNALEEFLDVMRKRDPVAFPDLSLAIIKLLGRGEYVVEEPGDEQMNHFGLAVRDYTHSTAPNRRYPDLITQRLVKAALFQKKAPYTRGELEQLARHCTEREDAANKVERQLTKAAAALALSPRIGERFEAIVTGASAKGVWVRILQPPIEGKLVKGARGLDVGDRVRVKLIATDPERGFIDFSRDDRLSKSRLRHGRQ